MIRFHHVALCGVVGLLAAPMASADLVQVEVSIENLAPTNGNFLTPFWVGFHDGNFDTYNSGEAASVGLERLAEDGNNGPLSDMFNSSGFGSVDGTVGMAPLAPGDVASSIFTLDSDDPASRYFNYASMILPSNDAFVANGNPLVHEIFDAGGNLIGAEFFILGSEVLDAGTEVNDELPENTAFFGQMAPNTGVTEGGVIGAHPGFLGSAGNPGTPSILADPLFSRADFTLPGYPIARITVSLVPAPGAMALFGLAGFAGRRRRRG